MNKKNNHWVLRSATLMFLLGVALSSKTLRAADESLTVRGFTDLSYVFQKSSGSNQFRDGALDLFFSKTIDKKISFLAELNYEPQEDNSLNADLERVSAQYTVNPWLKVGAGRFHTALGYWNETFHHGTYLHTSVSRPYAVRFEDSGGFLPTHLVGIEVRGNGQVGKGNFGYIANVGNGRNSQKDPPQTYKDQDTKKAYSGVLYYEFENGLRVGVSGYYDSLPGGSISWPDSSTTIQAAKGTETIFGGHVVYNSSLVEFLNEGWVMKHSYTSSYTDDSGSLQKDKDSTINMFYTQLGVHFGLFTPYYRFERIQPVGYDRFLAQASTNPLTGTQKYHTAGVRYELTASTALKVEHEEILRQNQNNDTKDSLNWSMGF